jgi:uncharacterized protein YceH (UPF0502 family)
MWGLDYSTLKEGQYVAVSRTGNWRTHNEGVYRVVKANKLKVVLERQVDGYTREFSVKRRVELGKNESRWSSPFIEAVADMEKREAQYAAERDRKQTWSEAEQAARDKDLAKLKVIVAKLEQMAV